MRWLARLSIVSALGFASLSLPLSSAQHQPTWWRPGPLRSWAYVIGENYPLTIPPVVDGRQQPVQAVDADLGDESGLSRAGAPRPAKAIEASVERIHAMGGHAICYVDAGSAESWRSDYKKFDPSELGRPLPDWPGERFVNVTDWSKPVPRRYETIKRIMSLRIALCKKEGFDAIEADNVDAYTDGNLGGFRLSKASEERFVERLIALAHRDGLAFFLKNEINGDGILRALAPRVQGEVDEQCWQYRDCSALRIFLSEHKPILNVEYEKRPAARLCPPASAFPMATIRAGLDLSGRVIYGCWPGGH